MVARSNVAPQWLIWLRGRQGNHGDAGDNHKEHDNIGDYGPVADEQSDHESSYDQTDADEHFDAMGHFGEDLIDPIQETHESAP
jgi:hypothetical protein